MRRVDIFITDLRAEDIPRNPTGGHCREVLVREFVGETGYGFKTYIRRNDLIHSSDLGAAATKFWTRRLLRQLALEVSRVQSPHEERTS